MIYLNLLMEKLLDGYENVIFLFLWYVDELIDSVKNEV